MGSLSYSDIPAYIYIFWHTQKKKKKGLSRSFVSKVKCFDICIYLFLAFAWNSEILLTLPLISITF